MYADLPIHSQDFLDSQLFGPDRVTNRTPMSALAARLLSDKVFQSVAQLHFNNLLGRNREPYLGTFSFRNGEVGMGECRRYVQTSISRTKGSLVEFGLEGVVVPDIDILLPSPDEPPTVAFHLQALVTGAGGRKVRLRSTAEKMSQWIGWESR
jgi:hypothetical protein